MTFWPSGGGGGRVQSAHSYVNYYTSSAGERVPQWYTNAGNASTTSVISGGAPAQVQVLAEFDCHAKVTIRPDVPFTGSGWGDCTVRLFVGRSGTAVASETIDVSTDAGATFDLSGHDIDAGDLVAISIENSTADKPMMVQLNLHER